MLDEMHALHSNDTWELVERPAGKNVLGCKWLYRIKL